MCNRVKEYLLELRRQQEQAEKDFTLQIQQNQTVIQDIDGKPLSSLELVNSLLNGRIQTVNLMKYHSRILQAEHNIKFEYHYLRHTYGTNLATLNTPSHTLCSQMGHSSSQVTQKYYIATSSKGINELLNKLEMV